MCSINILNYFWMRACALSISLLSTLLKGLFSLTKQISSYTGFTQREGQGSTSLIKGLSGEVLREWPRGQ